MLSVVSGFIWGEEAKEEGVRESEDEWVLVEEPQEEEKLFASAVAHMVPGKSSSLGLPSLTLPPQACRAPGPPRSPTPSLPHHPP